MPEARLASFQTTLDSNEQARAQRYRFNQPRRRFIAAHGIGREILGRYLTVPAEGVQFQHNSFGKPELAGLPPDRLQFSFAHSEDLALYAVTVGRPVGVDVERRRPVEDAEQLVQRFFAPTEYAVFKNLPPEQKLLGFFAGWTRKEAYTKALGLGLSLPLNQFEVSLAPDVPAALLADDQHPENVADWSLAELDVAPGYTAALAIRGAPGPISYWHWE